MLAFSGIPPMMLQEIVGAPAFKSVSRDHPLITDDASLVIILDITWTG